MNPSTIYPDYEEDDEEDFEEESSSRRPIGFLSHVDIECCYCGEHVSAPCSSAKVAAKRCGVKAETESSPIEPRHYSNFAIEPIEFISQNHLPFAEGNVIKYICRHPMKNGAEDIKKAIQYCKFILKYTYGIEDP